MGSPLSMAQVAPKAAQSPSEQSAEMITEPWHLGVQPGRHCGRPPCITQPSPELAQSTVEQSDETALDPSHAGAQDAWHSG